MDFTIFSAITAAITAVFLIFFAMLMDTNNTQSMIIFKFVPLVLGILNVIISLKQFNII